MSRPSVFIAWCTRTAKCPFCPEPTKVGEAVVVVTYYNENHHTKRNEYHPACWIQQGLDKLKLTPYRPKGDRGRPELTLVSEVKGRRALLLRKKAALEQQKKRLKSTYPERLLLEARIDESMGAVMLEISSLGGIPPKWLEKILNQ